MCRLLVFARGQRVDVCEILGTCRRALIAKKGLTAEERHLVTAAGAHRVVAPGVVPRHTADRAHHVDLDRLDAQLTMTVQRVSEAKLDERLARDTDALGFLIYAGLEISVRRSISWFRNASTPADCASLQPSARASGRTSNE